MGNAHWAWSKQNFPVDSWHIIVFLKISRVGALDTDIRGAARTFSSFKTAAAAKLFCSKQSSFNTIYSLFQFGTTAEKLCRKALVYYYVE